MAGSTTFHAVQVRNIIGDRFGLSLLDKASLV